MDGTMTIIVEASRRVDLHIHGPLLDAAELRAHEAVVPALVLRDQEEAADLVREQQLGLRAEGRAEAAGGVGLGVFVGGAPRVAGGCEGPGGEGDGAGGEADGEGYGLFVPGWMRGH